MKLAEAATTGANRSIALFVSTVAFLAVGVAGTSLPTRVAEFRLIVELGVVITLGAWAVLRLGRSTSPMAIPLFGALSALVLVSLASRDVRGSTETVALAAAFVLLFLLVRDASSRRDLHASLAVGAFWAATVWLSVIAVGWIAEKVLWVIAVGGVPPLIPYATFLWESPNVPPFLTLLGMGCLPWLTRGRWSAIGVRAFWAASAVVVPLSVGRAAWLGIAVALLAYVVMYRGGAHRKPRWASLFGLPRLPLSVIGLLVMLLALGLAATSGALNSRFPIWQQAIAIFLADPVTGGGPSTFAWLRFEYVSDYANPLVTEHAHSIVLQTLADGGLILLAAGGLVVWAYVREAWRTRREASNAHRLGYAVLAGFAASTLLDHLATLNAIFGLAVAIAAWSLPQAQEDGPAAPSQRSGLLAVLATLVVISTPAVTSIAAARLEAAAAREEFRSERHAEAAAHFQRAHELYPENAAYALGLGAALVQLAQPEAAAEIFEVATQLSPGDPRAWAAAASLRPEFATKVDYLRRAALEAHGDPQYSFWLAEILEAAGETDNAADQYAIAAMLRPLLLQQIDQAAIREQTRTLLPGILTELGSRARLSVAQVEAGIALTVGEQPDAAFPAWQAVYFAQLGDANAAKAALESAIQRDRHAPATWAAHEAVGLLICDEAVFHRGEIAGSLLRERRRIAVVQWDPAYREDGLGDYQVAPTPGGPIHVPPFDMVTAFPDCP